ncbi:uncharacterized protein LOC144446210 [Glandiceps talaboti]
MASSLVQSFIDKENPVHITSGKNRMGSTSGRQIVGKTFGTNNAPPMATPRKAFGNINDQGARTALGNVTNTAKKIAPTHLKKPVLQSKTPGPSKLSLKLPSMDTPSLLGPDVRRKTTSSVFAQKFVKRQSLEDFPDIEYMPDYIEEDDSVFDVWGEDGRPSASSIWSSNKCRLIPDMDNIFDEKKKKRDYCSDLSTLTIEPVPECTPAEFEDLFVNIDEIAKGMDFTDLPPVELPDLSLLLI